MIEIEELNTSDPNAFWDHVKRLGPRKNKKIPVEIYDEDGSLNGSIDKVKEKWNSEFGKIYAGPDKDFDIEFYNSCLIDKMVYEESMKDPLYVENPALNQNFTLAEVEKMVLKRKNKKAMGVDRIPNEILKNKNVIQLLHKLFNNCFSSNMVPGKWLQAIVFPILKNTKSDARIPLNYRGISLLSTISKCYTSLLNFRLQNYLEDESMLVDEQNGFRKGRSCQDHIFTLSSMVRNRNRINLSTYAAFIDFKKAFDYVNRDLLMYKLLKCNVDGHMYQAIKALYQNTTACMQINEHFTSWFPTSCGVRQGDNLSPTLFNLFLNDLALELKSMNCGLKFNGEDLCILLYADDIILLSDSEEHLQLLLNHVDNWCKKWQLVINSDKSKMMHFRKKAVDRTVTDFKLGNDVLETVDSYKYLGVVIDEFLDFSKTVDSLAVGGGRALGAINAKFKSLKNMGINTYSKLFDNCVIPVLHYSAGVWGLQSYNGLQNVQNRAMRFFLGTHKFTPTLGMFGDLGWYPLVMYRKIEAIRLWNRLIKLPEDRLTKRVFMWDWNQSQKNWSSEVKKLYYDVNMNEYFDGMQVCNLNDLSEALKGNFEQAWPNKVQEKVKLRTYRQLKPPLGWKIIYF